MLMIFPWRREQFLDLASPHVRQNPYPTYAQLRKTNPIALVKVPFFGKTYFVSRYDDVASALRDPRISTDMIRYAQMNGAPVKHIPRTFQVLLQNMLTTDDPQHRRLRTLVHKAFTPKRIADMENEIRELTTRLLDTMKNKRQVDLIADYALPIPMTVISEMLKVPEEDRLQFHHAVTSFLESTSSGIWQMVTQFRKLRKIVRYFEELVQSRRKHLGDDLLSAMIEAEEAGDRLNQDELIGMIFLLLLAGHETSVNLVASGTLALLEHPQELQLLQNNPELIDSAIEELVRYTNPIELSTPRFALEAIEWHGVTIPAGHRILVGIGSANRDDTVFSNPDTLQITRSPNKHLGFGLGAHYCLGAPLATTTRKHCNEFITGTFPEYAIGGFLKLPHLA